MTEDDTTMCGRRFSHGPEVCRREPGHPGLHRDNRSFKAAERHWGDNETKATPSSAEGDTTMSDWEIAAMAHGIFTGELPPNGA